MNSRPSDLRNTASAPYDLHFSEIAGVANDPAPRANSNKVEMLRNNEFVRVWINRGGNHYLIHLIAG